jgi:hypothetical protein
VTAPDTPTSSGSGVVGRPRWRAVGEAGSFLGHRHTGSGRLDETARRLGHEELEVAKVLVREGHDVRSLREVRGGGPTADLSVCGTRVEVKSWLPLDERDGRVPSARSVFNKLASASRQAGVVVLNGLGRGITPAIARQGMLLYEQRGVTKAREISRVRVLGDGFDLVFDRAPSLLRRPAHGSHAYDGPVHDRSGGRSPAPEGLRLDKNRARERRPSPEPGLGI